MSNEQNAALPTDVYAPTPIDRRIGPLESVRQCMAEVWQAARLWRLWMFWGWLDVRQRYRRSLLGPFWVTATMAISVMATGIVYAFLFQQNVREYLPYVAIGFVLWSFVAGFIGEASSVFIQNEGFIGQLKLPYLVYPLRLIWRYIVFFLHHAVVLLAVLIAFVPFGLNSLLGATLGLAVTSVNIFWMGLLVGLISVRLRDLPMLVATIFQVLFLVTPVIWPAKALGSRATLADYNPLYHMLESIRSPLLDQAVTPFNHHLQISMVMAIAGSLITLALYSRWHRRILYWL
jgi:ABC-type polysaccharide/polyol phosphate export permease